jgi:hypothetical protein
LGVDLGANSYPPYRKHRFELLKVGKIKGKRPFGRPRRACEDNIKMDLKEIELEGAD